MPLGWQGTRTFVVTSASGGHKLGGHQGELAIYSENFDRYPLDPTLVFTLEEKAPR